MFPENFAKFFRTLILQNACECMLVYWEEFYSTLFLNTSEQCFDLETATRSVCIRSFLVSIFRIRTEYGPEILGIRKLSYSYDHIVI